MKMEYMSQNNGPINHIAAYGCSFVYGDGIDHNKSWPYVLGNMLNVSVSNRGNSGSSNKFSIINLLTDISTFDYTNTLVVIGWTGCRRTAFYNEKEKNWENIHVSFRYPTAMQKTVDTYYNSIYTDYDAYLTMCWQQIMVQSFLEQHGIRHCFINSLNEIYDMLDLLNNDDSFKRIYDLIKQEKFVLGYHHSIQELINNNPDLISNDGCHPSEQGHRLVADLIIKHLKEWKLI